MMTGLFLVGGCVLLWLGAEALVAGSVAVARRFALSPVVVGVMLVGFGTSIPELAVSLDAARLGSADIAIGNVLGSNTANVLLILGLAGLVAPVQADRAALAPETWLMLVAAVFLAMLLVWGPMDRIDGALCVLLLAVYTIIALLKRTAKSAPGGWRSVPLGLALALIGLAGVLAGSHLLVEGALALARDSGLSEAALGATVVAVGTSLPELSATLVAARRGQADLAVGNILGSNIFNVFGVLGAAATVLPLGLSPDALARDLPATLAATLLLAGLVLGGRCIGRGTGATLLALYAGYLALML